MLGDLFLGPSPEAVALARQLPALAPAFPADADPDALAASHHRVLGLETLPYAPVFLAPDGLLRDPARDHVGACLHAVAAGAPGAHDTALRVLPPLVLAVRDAGDPGWSLVAELALELAVSEDRRPLPFALAAALPDLREGRTGLRDIALALVRPAASGWFPTLRALGRIARAAEVAGGFGGRADRLHATLLAAVDAGRAGALLAAVDDELARWHAGLSGLAELDAPVEPWQGRIAETRTWIADIRLAALST